MSHADGTRVVVVTSSQTPGCFGVYSSDEMAYKAIERAYGGTVARIDKPNWRVHMTTGEVLSLLARHLDR